MDDDAIRKLMGADAKGPCNRCGKQAPYIGGWYDGNTGEDVREFLCDTCEDRPDALMRIASISARH